MFRFFFRISLLTAVSFLFWYIPGRFLNAPLFRVKTPKIVFRDRGGGEGDVKISENELTEIGEITYNSSIWEIDCKSIEELLKKDVRIKDARVYPSAPDELTFEITEREPFSYIQQDSRIYLLDEEGVLFGFLNEKEKRDLPLFVIRDNDPEKARKTKTFIEIIKNMDETLLKDISQIQESDKYCVNLILSDGTIVRTNHEVERGKYKIAGNLYYELKSDGKRIEYIDLRFENFVVKESDGEKKAEQ